MNAVQRFIAEMTRAAGVAVDAIRKAYGKAIARFRKPAGPIEVPIKVGTEIVLTNAGKPIARFTLMRVTFNYKRPNEIEFLDSVEFLRRSQLDPRVYPGGEYRR